MHKQSQLVLRWHCGARVLMAKASLVPRMVAMLVLVIVSAGQTLVAQAQTAVDFDLVIGGPPGNICFHEKVSYTVHVFRKIQAVSPGALIPGISRIDVHAQITDSTVITGGNDIHVLHADLSDPEALEPLVVYLNMTAQNKVGSTTITFVVDVIPFTRIIKEVPVKVESCKVKVSWINNWGPITAGTGGSVGISGHFDEAVLTADDNGHYTGTTKVTWKPSISLPPRCAPHDTIEATDVDIKGDIDQNGMLKLTLTFQGASLEEDHACGNIHHTSNALAAQELRVPPLPLQRISTPVSQNLKVKNSISIRGSAKVSISIDRGD